MLLILRLLMQIGNSMNNDRTLRKINNFHFLNRTSIILVDSINAVM